jgi:hypothetical protein
VARTAAIDPFCSRHEWSLSWHEVYGAHRRIRAFTRDDSLVVLAGAETDDLLVPLEAMWGYGSPLLGADPVGLLLDLLARGPDLGERILLLGLPDDEAMLQRLARGLPGGWELMVPMGFADTIRPLASLVGGVDGFLARRSRNLRRSVHRAWRRAVGLGIEFVRVRCVDEAAVDAVWARVLDVERRSWKGREGKGVIEAEFAEFYRVMIRRLLHSGDFRLVFARLDGRDIAYLHGAVLGRIFRGFQFSFDDDYRHAAPGNLVQLQMIEWVGEDGVESYDLGWNADYKARWTDAVPLVTRNALLWRRGS